MQLKEGLVSVIIPCYNNAQYINKCVESILNQTYTNFEIIIIDDGSDDNPTHALANIQDTRLSEIILLPHRGVSSARNVGIEAAKGEYIIFIDGDDWVEPNHIESLVGGLSYADCSLIEMVLDFPDFCEVNKDTVRVFSDYSIIEKKKFHILFDSYLLSSPCNKIYKTSLLKGKDYLRFDTSISYAEDLIFNLEYFERIESVKLCPELLVAIGILFTLYPEC